MNRWAVRPGSCSTMGIVVGIAAVAALMASLVGAPVKMAVRPSSVIGQGSGEDSRAAMFVARPK